MKKLFTLILLSILLTACNTNEETKPVQNNNYDTVEYRVNSINDQGEIYVNDLYLDAATVKQYNINSGDNITVTFDDMEIVDIKK